MTQVQNRNIVHRFFAEVVNGRDLAAADELLAADFVDHGLPAGRPPGLDGFKGFLRMLGTAFPDLRVSIEDTVADGDRVAVRLAIRGTHRGELFGIAPTQRAVSWTGVDIIRIADGRIAERWGERDLLGLMEQLGAIRGPGRGQE